MSIWGGETRVARINHLGFRSPRRWTRPVLALAVIYVRTQPISRSARVRRVHSPTRETTKGVAAMRLLPNYSRTLVILIGVAQLSLPLTDRRTVCTKTEIDTVQETIRRCWDSATCEPRCTQRLFPRRSAKLHIFPYTSLVLLCRIRDYRIPRPGSASTCRCFLQCSDTVGWVFWPIMCLVGR